MLAAVAVGAACSADDTTERACGAFDVGSTWEKAKEDPVAAGVQCLIDAFEDGDPASLSFSYLATNGGAQMALTFEYEVLAGNSVLVRATRLGPAVAASLRETVDVCSALGIDSSGAPVGARCSPRRGGA